MSHKYDKKEHGSGYEGIYNFIAQKHDCAKHMSEQIGSYQGDAIAVFVRKDGMVGILDHAYGSCSGCDDYEAVNSYEDETNNNLVELANDYEQRVRWTTRDEALKRCDELWLEGQAGYHLDKETYTEIYKQAIPSFLNN